LCFFGQQLFLIGDWEGFRDVVAAATEADPNHPSVLNLRVGEAAIRGDFASAVSIGHAAAEQERRADNDRYVSFMLGHAALTGSVVDPVQALRDAEDAVATARRCQATSALLYPLMVLSLAASDPDRALEAADECVRLDQTHRKLWSTNCEGPAAKLRFGRGNRADGLHLWKDQFSRLYWSGERGQPSMALGPMADSIADIDPDLAIEFAAISESDAIAPFPVFDALAGYHYQRLAQALDELGPDALHAARSRAASMTYDEAMSYILENLERLIKDAEALKRHDT
jgi:hypothetical protein